MPAEPTVPTSSFAPISPDGPTVPIVEQGAPTPGEEPTLPTGTPTTATMPIPPAGAGQNDQTLALTPGANAQAKPAEDNQPAARTEPAGQTKTMAQTKPAPQTKPVQPAKPEKWAGRVAVPGAVVPGQKKPAAPTTPTQKMARVSEPTPTVVAPRATSKATPRPQAPLRQAAPRRRRSGVRRFLGAVVALLLLIAVPVVSAYVAYKLASDENPFNWPPTVDLSRVF